SENCVSNDTEVAGKPGVGVVPPLSDPALATAPALSPPGAKRATRATTRPADPPLGRAQLLLCGKGIRASPPPRARLEPTMITRIDFDDLANGGTGEYPDVPALLEEIPRLY